MHVLGMALMVRELARPTGRPDDGDLIQTITGGNAKRPARRRRTAPTSRRAQPLGVRISPR
ncbi:MAG TPA: hypothetical protein VF129_06550 [Actinomycetota bacterium]